MHLSWIFPLLLISAKVASYSKKARLAEWNIDPSRDKVDDILKLLSQGQNISDFLQEDQETKREISFSTTGFRIEAAAFTERFKKTPKLGDCTTGNHKYEGEHKYIVFPRVQYKFSRMSERLQSSKYTDVMGGIGVNFFGLFGASAKVRVISSVKRDSKSLIIYSHLITHRGIISLVNAQRGANWQSCDKVDEHYYLRDILTGMEDYIVIQLKFASEKKRKEVEIKIKVKILFFTISKTIRRVKTETSSQFNVSIYRVRTFPERIEEKYTFGDADTGMGYIEALEKGRQAVFKEVKARKYDDPALHLEYFFVPCLIKTVLNDIPFKQVNNFILVQLVERATEMESVLKDVETCEAKVTGEKKERLEHFQIELVSRLNKIGNWKTKKLSHVDVNKFFEIYGSNRAPYFYERELGRIMQN